MLRAVTSVHPQQNCIVLPCLLMCPQVVNRADVEPIFVCEHLGIFAMAVHPQMVLRMGLITPMQQTPNCSTCIFILLTGMSAHCDVL